MEEKVEISDMNNKQKVIVVCGYKNTGKTWMMKQLIHRFSTQGYDVASIKHDGHEFDSDVEGRDSDQHYKAGAYASAIFSSQRWAMVKDESVSLDDMVKQFTEADIIFVEGCKDSTYPKIEMLRKGYQEEVIPHLENRIAIVTDFPYVDYDKNVYQTTKLEPLFAYLKTYIEGDNNA